MGSFAGNIPMLEEGMMGDKDIRMAFLWAFRALGHFPLG